MNEDITKMTDDLDELLDFLEMQVYDDRFKISEVHKFMNTIEEVIFHLKNR